MIDVSIMISVFNGAPLVRERVLDFMKAMTATRWSWEILLIDDGSTDATAEECRALTTQFPYCRFLGHSENKGRGFRIRQHIPECQGDVIGYVDVDRSTPAYNAIALLIALENGFDVAEVYRHYRLGWRSWPWTLHRFLGHCIYQWIVSQTLGLQDHDTESGFKFFRRNALEDIREQSFAPGWFWDTEMIANAHRLGLRVAEIHSVFTHTARTTSTVRFLPDAFRQWRELRHHLKTRGPACVQPDCCAHETPIRRYAEI